jgi:DNA primase
VNLKKQVFQCFKCSTKGKTNVNFGTLKLVHFDTPKDNPVITKTLNHRMPNATPDIITPSALRYLDRRNIKESDVARHKMFSASSNSIYFGRIIIPINPFRGYADYFVARAYTKLGIPKYLNPGGNKSLFISPPGTDEYFEQYWDTDQVCLVEGPFDFLKASRHGPCIALLGKTLSLEAARAIVARFSKAFILLDTGLTESMAALRVADMLRNHIDTELIHIPKYLNAKDPKDPGDMNPQDFKELFT